MIKIPITNSPEQIFTIELFGVVYQLRILLNFRLARWSISFKSELGEQLIDGISMVGGVDILDAHNLPFKDMYIVNLANITQDPTIENLGTDSILMIIEEGDI